MSQKPRIGRRPSRNDYDQAEADELARRFIEGDATPPETPVTFSAETPKRGRPPQYPGQGMTRLTIDIPTSLRNRAKIGAFRRGTTLAAIVRTHLEKEFPSD